jgi:hypothetical protein
MNQTWIMPNTNNQNILQRCTLAGLSPESSARCRISAMLAPNIIVNSPLI